MKSRFTRIKIEIIHTPNKIASFFLTQGVLSVEDYSWAAYAFHRIFLTLIFYPLLFIIGCYISDIFQTTCFFVVFTSFRHRVGGHHAPSVGRCFLNSALIVICGLGIYPVIVSFTSRGFRLILLFCAAILIFVVGSCNDPHIALSPQELAKNTKRTRNFVILVIIMGITSYLFLPKYQLLDPITSAALISAIMLIAGKVQNHKIYE